MAGTGDRRWGAVTLLIALVVALVAMLGVAGLRLAQMRAVPMAAPRAQPVQGAGSTAVEVSTDAWAHPSAPIVQDVLTRYFDAINSKNYQAWAAVVTPALVNQMPESNWRQGYASTTDGTIRVSRIDAFGPGKLVALVSYVSVQRPEDGPEGLKTGRICWRAAFPLVGTPPVIDLGKPGSVLLRGAC